MTAHTIDYYMDGFAAILFCKVCSAEGDALHNACQGPFVSGVVYFQDMTREEFEEKYEKCIDESKQSAKK